MREPHKSHAENFLSGLRQVLGTTESTVPLHEPEFRGREWSYVKECIDTGWVSSVGKFVDEFELRLAEFTGAKHAIATVNGTAAQHMALLLAGVTHNDEVIVPGLSFVATANAVCHCGAIPHFADCDITTLGLNPDALDAYLHSITEKTSEGLRNAKTGRRIAAIVPMHTFGHSVDMTRLMDVASRFGLPIVEDAAESLGSHYQNRHTGTIGLLGILSFNGNKIITTGGGGAILTNNAVLAKHAKHLTTTAKQPHRWEFFHDEVAYNYRLPNLNAALGCAQLERLPDMLERKRRLALRYKEVFDSLPGMHFVVEPTGCHSNYWLNAIRLQKPDRELRDALLEEANNSGYQCRPIWTLLHKLPMYQSCPRAPLPVAEALEASVINIPSSAKLAGLMA